jgi:predicted lactoylglutathione lyase
LAFFDVPEGQNICRRNLNFDLTSRRDGIFVHTFSSDVLNPAGISSGIGTALLEIFNPSGIMMNYNTVRKTSIAESGIKLFNKQQNNLSLMATQIFVNLPVKDLDKSVAFFTELGYSFNPNFTDEKATCMIISDSIFAMLLVEPYFMSFTKKEIPDTSKAAEVTLALSRESRAEVDSIVNMAIKAGGKAHNEPNDMGFMYSWGYEDLDGHIWEVMWMDPSGMPEE